MVVIGCYLDEYVIRSLGFPKRSYKHESGKGKVLEQVRKRPNAIGMVDEDPSSNQPRDMENYVETASGPGLKLLTRKKDDGKRIIVIRPRLEEWILLRANQHRISPKDHGLPTDAHGWKSILHIEKGKSFQEFFQKLLDSNDEEIEKLREWIHEALEG